MLRLPGPGFPALAALLGLGCRAGGCGGEGATVLDPSGVWGHETLELTLAASGDQAVVSLASLFDRGIEQCACLLLMRARGPGRWTSEGTQGSVELVMEGGDLVIRPTRGAADLACCSALWSGDGAPLASRQPLGRCRITSSETIVSQPASDFGEPDEGDSIAYRGDLIEGTPLWGAIDEWVVGRRVGPDPWAGLVPVRDLVCAPAGEELPLAD